MSVRAAGRLLLGGAPRRHRVTGASPPIPERLRLFERLRGEQRDGGGTGGGTGDPPLPPGTPISITLPGGRRLPGRALQTTPLQVALELGGPRSLQCREQPVLAHGALELLLESPPQGWKTVEWRVFLDAGQKQRILTVEKNKSAAAKGHFSGRAFFQQETLSLNISPVGLEDNGEYRAEFIDFPDIVAIQCFRVKVWEPVPQPQLETRVLLRELGHCNLSLLCTLPSTHHVSYSWVCSGGPWGALGHQPQLNLQVEEGIKPTVCQCNVSNPVSWSTSSSDLGATCGAAGPGHFSFFPPWAVALCTVLPLVFCIALVVTCCWWWRKRGKKPPGEDTEQTSTIYAVVGQDRTSRDPYGTSEATTGERTIYAAICTEPQGHKSRSPWLVNQVGFLIPLLCCLMAAPCSSPQSSSARKKRLDPALVSTVYTEDTGGYRQRCPPLHTTHPAGHHFS
ncbi:natural killer cell receptor 2B4 [Apus apus]|uniref:natural killer cell receptor 2B4 n=1 Tax=Apus apus TaxID=8895 RepID=UPI0021F87F46|nr:natural killer cell receptor 2B4 [Apus apus]